jgi:hypothetical protein
MLEADDFLHWNHAQRVLFAPKNDAEARAGAMLLASSTGRSIHAGSKYAYRVGGAQTRLPAAALIDPQAEQSHSGARCKIELRAELAFCTDAVGAQASLRIERSVSDLSSGNRIFRVRSHAL